ncbi:DUF3592 domain-containing protein [Streptomyces yaizuensis]|uniref:DUF3592 domain-containing protein n=1 Tax=Streptomyces yaizuensis TaxID=2989713 RepID=A0ABQ5NU76_9ACTN|nr:DUF3592 domain-containing protein [Streptomyces sp. YSPA8]GLF93900.1 DUF3592 domain-containing protein [Streptomyces sp. YSPA8]
MSTVDPAAGRRRRAPLQDSGRPPAGVRTVLGLVVYGGLWTLFGTALADLASHPVGSLYLADGTEPPNDTPGLLWAFFAALLAGSLTGVGLRGPLLERLGPTLQSALSSTVVNTGIAVGIVLGARSLWRRPPETGRFADPAGGAGEAWGAGPWAAWTAQYWVPAVLLFLVVLRIWVSLGYEHAERRRVARTRTVCATGVRTRGVVTVARESGLVIGERPRLHFTVWFTDRAGEARSVTRTAAFARDELPRAGDRAVVWYDPADRDAVAVALADPDLLGERDLLEALALGGLVIH